MINYRIVQEESKIEFRFTINSIGISVRLFVTRFPKPHVELCGIPMNFIEFLY